MKVKHQDLKFRSELTQLICDLGLHGSGVEIGVAEGRFSEILIKSPHFDKFYMIDAWQQLNQKGDGHNPQSWHDNNYKEALERTEKYADKRVVLRGLSNEMIKQIPDNSLILAYVDGDHSFQGCLNDLDAIWPKIQVGGVLAGHDILNDSYGVKRAVNVFFREQFVNGRPTNRCLDSVYAGSEINIIPEDEPVNASFYVIKK
jgi:hypothetical protein